MAIPHQITDMLHAIMLLSATWSSTSFCMQFVPFGSPFFTKLNGYTIAVYITFFLALAFAVSTQMLKHGKKCRLMALVMHFIVSALLIVAMGILTAGKFEVSPGMPVPVKNLLSGPAYWFGWIAVATNLMLGAFGLQNDDEYHGVRY